jgi:hypothetical protein
MTPTEQDEFRGCWLVWTVPLARPKMKAQAGDVTLALDWYKKTTHGIRPWAIRFHPTMDFLAKEVPEGIQVRYSGGSLVWQIQIADAKLFATEGAHAE